MRIVESVLSPHPNVRSSVLWSERNVRSLKPIPDPPRQGNARRGLFNVNQMLEGTVNFVRKNVLSANTLSLFAGITCTVAVVLAVWAIYMFKEQKAKMRNLQNMVVDMTLSEAKQRNGGVSSIQQQQQPIHPVKPRPMYTPSPATTGPPPMSMTEAVMLPIIDPHHLRNLQNVKVDSYMEDEQQFHELRRVQAEVARLLTNPVNIIMEKPTSTVTIEDITNLRDNSNREVNNLVRETMDQRKRFETVLNSFDIQSRTEPRILRKPLMEEYEDEEEDDDFLQDLDLYREKEEELLENAQELQNDLQLVMAHAR